MEKKKIIIVDDRPLLRDAWSMILQNNENWIVTDKVEKNKDALKRIRLKKPNVLFLQVNIPFEDDARFIKLSRRYSPSTKIIAVGLFPEHNHAKKLIAYGAKGYIDTECKAQEILEAVDEVLNGKIYLCHELKNTSKSSKREADRFKKLTKREVQIIQFLRKGYSSKDIAKEISIAPRTVDSHRFKILRKLGVKNTGALIQVVNEFGL